MDSFDSSEFTIMPTAGERLLSESPLLKPHASYSGGDLSLSELSLSHRSNDSNERVEDFDDAEEAQQNLLLEEEGVEEVDPEELARIKRQAAKTREEKLQHDLFLLKKLNGAFALYTDALRATQSSTERLKARLKDTNSLLDRYVGMLDRSETVTQMILDERWQGADADEETLQRLQYEEIEQQRKEAKERELAEQRERKRLEREQQEREEREERERIERERREKKPPTRGTVPPVGASSGVRGVRGTRASMRARGVARGAAPVATAQPTSRIARPASSASGRGSIPVRAQGRGS